ncbi:MAG TPA: DMT family transporter [Ktedonobacteraceae bacterium]|nr:DMT family transporter [Ktedonobacteraceae bacterium]
MRHKLLTQRFGGILFIIISAISFGAMPVFARIAYEAKADPLTVLFLRFGIAAIVMFAILLASKTAVPRGLLLLELILLGAIAYVGESLAYFTALTMASPGLVALLLYIYPALVTMLSAIFLKEHLTTMKIVALFLALSGTALTIQVTSGGSFAGILLGIAAAVDYAIYIVLGSRIVKRSGSVGSTAIIIASTAGVYAIIAPMHRLSFPVSAQGWAAILAIALVSTVLAFMTFFAGLTRIGPTTASTLSTFEPIVAVALATIVLGETITPVQALGGVFILAAVVILSRNELRREKRAREQAAADGSGEARDERLVAATHDS